MIRFLQNGSRISQKCKLLQFTHRSQTPWKHTLQSFSTKLIDEAWEKPELDIHRILDGKPIRFGSGSIATLADSSVLGSSGRTVILATVCKESLSNNTTTTNDSSTNIVSMLQQQSMPSDFFTVSYQERYHGAGKIPTTNRKRRDGSGISDDEILAGRAVDRALRPLMQNRQSKDSSRNGGDGRIHVSCSVQSHDGRGNPVALAINAASAALGSQNMIQERVAAVHVCLVMDTKSQFGSFVVDPTPDQVEMAAASLLYAGTRDHVVMMEANSPTQPIPEHILISMMELAHAAIQPILDTQEQIVVSTPAEKMSDEQMMATLGLTIKPTEISDESTSLQEDVDTLLNDAYIHCYDRFGSAALRLFGLKDENGNMETNTSSSESSSNVQIHPDATTLLTKSFRGRREHLLSSEIKRFLAQEYEPSNERWRARFLEVKDREILASSLASTVIKKLFSHSLYVASSKHGGRGDQRCHDGSRTIRTIGVTVPALPDTVHGSSLFSRGDTQVLCTTTLGAPSDGMQRNDLYSSTEKDQSQREPGPFDDLPVGSLRYVRSQEAMISDYNSRKVQAEKELTGDSGTFDEVKRFFLQYDFPSFSKGDVPSGRGNRREVGHGRLAEKAIESVLPKPGDFPYAMRVTSEVTSSNGSSSMATVCGATLAMLDAGVPLLSPVAGISVGLALGETTSEYCLLLDITGTEDHYGWMDFKIAGTNEGVTALQLDVKKPLPMNILKEALELAKKGRTALLQEMELLAKERSFRIISKLLPRPMLKDSAPSVEIVRFDPLRKRDLIGPGGAVLRQLEDRFGISLDLTQEGQCLLFGLDRRKVLDAKVAVMEIVADVEVGQVYEGTIIELRDFGAIVELLRNKEGILHVSEVSDNISHPEGILGAVQQHLQVGQKIEVLCTEVDVVQGNIRLSRKALLNSRREEIEKRLDE